MNDLLAIKIQNLNISFNDRTLFSDANCTIPAGALTILLGPSGSGKSTLLRSINRLSQPSSLKSGSILAHLEGKWCDINAKNVDPVWLRRKIGMVLQVPRALPLSIEKNITIPIQLVLGLSASKAKDLAVEKLQEFGLWSEVENKMHLDARILSRGQQQRLCIARALALNPEILLLDEPTSSLDRDSSLKILTTLRQLKGKLTILASCHDVALAKEFADHILSVDASGLRKRIAKTF